MLAWLGTMIAISSQELYGALKLFISVQEEVNRFGWMGQTVEGYLGFSFEMPRLNLAHPKRILVSPTVV